MANPIVTRKTVSLTETNSLMDRLLTIENADQQPGFSIAEVVRARALLIDAKVVKFPPSITAISLKALLEELRAVNTIAREAQDTCVSECGGIEKKDCLVKSKCGRSVSIEVREDGASGTMQVFTVPVATVAIPKGRDTDAEMRARLQSQRR